MKLETLKDLYVEQLRDIYNAEKQIVEALPKMAESSSHTELKSAFTEHLEETRNQIKRLEEIFNNMDKKPGGEKCQAMEGIINEGEEMVKSKGEPDVIDAGLIAQAQRVEHYEIAAYGCCRTYAKMLGENNAVDLLQKSLNEEEDADAKLTDIAEEVVNVEAAAHH